MGMSVRFGKVAQVAVAAMSLLAEHYDKGKTKLNSAQIAETRELPQPIVAKVLTTLSSFGLVDGTRGPGGGYWLKKKPKDISLHDIIAEFERTDGGIMCPFGPNWCGNGEPCPMHDSLEEWAKNWRDYLESTNLEIFAQKGFLSTA